MTQTAEPIEIAIVVLAALAILASATMLARSWRTYRAAIAAGRCEAVRKLGWLRVRNEAYRLAISCGVCYAGWVNAAAPLPAIVTTNRGIFQAIWLGIAFAQLAQSVLNERDNRRIVMVIERERESGRMVGHAQGRVEERARVDAEKESS